MEEFNTIQIITGLGVALFIGLQLFKGFREACESKGWITQKRQQKKQKQQEEEDKRLIGLINSAVTEANKPQDAMLKQLKESSNDLMRHEMTKIYYKYLPYRRILQYDKESFVKLYKDYHLQDGNTFIDDIHDIMADWLVVTEEKDLMGSINTNIK